MNDTNPTTREILVNSELFGFDTGCWARGLANGRRAAARRGIKSMGMNTEINEELLLQTLNEPVQTAAAEEAPVADEAAAPTAAT